MSDEGDSLLSSLLRREQLSQPARVGCSVLMELGLNCHLEYVQRAALVGRAMRDDA